MKILQALCFIFCFTVLTNAQKSVLTGTIYDLSNSTIPKVKIIATDKKNRLTETFSNEKGIYFLTLNEGEYKIEFVTNGFRPTKIEGFKVGIDGNLKLDITMDIQDFIEHPPITSETKKSDFVSGILTGTVYDPNGAVIVKAKVAAINEKGERFETITNDAGIYNLELPYHQYDGKFNFRLAKYEIIVEKENFEKTIIKNFKFAPSYTGKVNLDFALDVFVNITTITIQKDKNNKEEK